ncbi:MAG: response regulator, partial [Thermoproteota archaeon]|nr:response regulator [Thermoproteota archaeon]
PETNELKSSEKIRTFYSIFFNTIASIILRHGGKVIKNIGDILLFYFPKTVNLAKMSSIQDVLDCGLDMIEAKSILNSNLNKNGLPSIDYRISVNYGKVELATSTNLNGVDLFGPAVNICSKINQLTLSNNMVIYKDLYEIIVKTSFFKEYCFKKISGDNERNDESRTYLYPIYYVHRIDNPKQQIEIDEKKRQKQKEQKQNKQNRSNSSFNILLIDDDDDILLTFTFIVEGAGYNVTSFSNSIKALDHLSSLDPYYYDLIVTDIRMPDFNGFQLFKQIKVLNTDTKVLFLSALDVAEEIMIICPGMKASDIIRKPIDNSDLLAKIESILRS